MSPKMPTELWLQTFKYMDTLTIHGPAKRVCRDLYQIASQFRFHGLTVEIWLKICIEYACYDDLKALMKAFKTFKCLLTRYKSSALDARLFREKPGSVEIKSDTVFQIHPALNHIHLKSLEAYEEGLPISFSWAFGDLDMAYLRPHDTLPENATSPPVTKITVSFLQALLGLINDDVGYDEVERPELMMEAIPSAKGKNIDVSSILNTSSALLQEYFLTNRQYDSLMRDQSDLKIDWKTNGSRLRQTGFQHLERFEPSLEVQSSGDIDLHLIPRFK